MLKRKDSLFFKLVPKDLTDCLLSILTTAPPHSPCLPDSHKTTRQTFRSQTWTTMSEDNVSAQKVKAVRDGYWSKIENFCWAHIISWSSLEHLGKGCRDGKNVFITTGWEDIKRKIIFFFWIFLRLFLVRMERESSNFSGFFLSEFVYGQNRERGQSVLLFGSATDGPCLCLLTIR